MDELKPPEPKPKRKYTKRKKKFTKLVDSGKQTQFKKGVSGLLMKKGIKKAMEDNLRLSMDYIIPEDWKINGLEMFKGAKITFAQALTFRLLYAATTGVRNPGLKDLQEILNRILGRMPTIIKHGEAEPEDDFESMTGEELIALGNKLATQIQEKNQKRLPRTTDDTEEERPNIPATLAPKA